MTWTKLGDEFGPESAGLTNGEFRTHVEALIYSNWRLLDLYVPKTELRRFTCSPSTDADVDGLVAKGWWQDAGHNWYIGLRFAEWQRDRFQVETRRAYLAEAQRRKRAHDAGDHSRCLPSAKCRSTSTVDSTVDPGRDGTVTGTAVRPKVNSTVIEPLSDAGGNSSRAEHEVREREARAKEVLTVPLVPKATAAEGGKPPSPSPQTGDGSNNGASQAHTFPTVVLAGAQPQTVTRAKTGRKPIPDDKRQAILSLHARGGLTLKQIADQAGVSKTTAHSVVHSVPS